MRNLERASERLLGIQSEFVETVGEEPLDRLRGDVGDERAVVTAVAVEDAKDLIVTVDLEVEVRVLIRRVQRLAASGVCVRKVGRCQPRRRLVRLEPRRLGQDASARQGAPSGGSGGGGGYVLRRPRLAAHVGEDKGAGAQPGVERQNGGGGGGLDRPLLVRQLLGMRGLGRNWVRRRSLLGRGGGLLTHLRWRLGHLLFCGRRSVLNKRSRQTIALRSRWLRRFSGLLVDARVLIGGGRGICHLELTTCRLSVLGPKLREARTIAAMKNPTTKAAEPSAYIKACNLGCGGQPSPAKSQSNADSGHADDTTSRAHTDKDGRGHGGKADSIRLHTADAGAHPIPNVSQSNVSEGDMWHVAEISSHIAASMTDSKKAAAPQRSAA